MLTRTPAEFTALPEMAATFVEPAYVVPTFAKLGQRWLSSLIGTFIQDCLAEIQSFMSGFGATPTAAELQTTDGSTQNIATISIPDGETVEVWAHFQGKRSGSVGFVSQYLHAVVCRQDSNSGVEILQIVEDTGPHVDSSGNLTSGSGSPVATVAANDATKVVELKVAGEPAKIIDWTCQYTYRRVS